MSAHHLTIRNETQGTELARAELRDSIVGRAIGLLGRSKLDAGDGIVISPCSSVHMFFMRFPLDVIYIDKERRVVKAVTDLKPWRISIGGRGAHTAIELPLGAVAASGTRPGDQLLFAE
jgi:uncharacterized membrane protein (UPF0127 family)